MIHQMFAIHDNKTQFFHQPFILPNLELAIRGFRQGVNDGSSYLAKSPSDYTLFHIGAYNDELGTITTLAAPVNLGLAANYKETQA